MNIKGKVLVVLTGVRYEYLTFTIHIRDSLCLINANLNT